MILPTSWQRTSIDYFSPTGRWECCALAPHIDGEFYWYKGWGTTQEAAVENCRGNWTAHKHLGKQQKQRAIIDRSRPIEPTLIGLTLQL